MRERELKPYVGLLAREQNRPLLLKKMETSLGRQLWQQLSAKLEEAVGESPQGAGGSPIAFGLAGWLTGREEYLDAAADGLRAALRGPSWRGRGPLGTGSSLARLCIAFDFCGNHLNEELRRQFLGAAVARAVENRRPDVRARAAETDRPFIADFADYTARQFHAGLHETNNWDVVCTSPLVMLPRLVEKYLDEAGLEELTPPRAEDDPALRVDRQACRRWYALGRERLLQFVGRCFSHQGEYAEGPSYYSYGVREALLMLEAARNGSGDDLYTPSLLRSPGWLRSLYPWDVGRGRFNFNDATWGSEAPEVLLRLAAESHDATAQRLALDLMECRENPSSEALALDFLWMDPWLEPGPMPSGRDAARDAVLGFRCGRWCGAHTHLDRNQFVLAAFGEYLAVDAGDCRRLEGAEHWKTAAHNAVLADNRGQVGNNQYPTHGCLLKAEHRDGLSLIIGDASLCYPHLTCALRTLLVHLPYYVVVFDILEGHADSFQWLVQTDNRDGKGRIGARDGHFVLERPAAELHVWPALEVDGFGTASGPMNHQQDAAVRLTLQGRGGRFLNILFPAKRGDAAPVPSVERAEGMVSVSCAERGLEVVLNTPSDALEWRGWGTVAPLAVLSEIVRRR